jgi:phosphopantothenoylcysteine decarboxylase/phosphopantothenate--cysteine ligase
MICANSVAGEEAGFGVDTNIITMITADAEIPLAKMQKAEAAHRILDEILRRTTQQEI